MTSMTDQSWRGPSPWERKLWAHFTDHVQAERGLLEEYSAIAEKSPSKAFRYLVNLLIEDEIRHHRIFTELAKSLESDALLTGEEPIIPYPDFEKADRAVLLEATTQLLQKEKDDAADLKRLQHELREGKVTLLWTVLVELMQRDTEKHIALLRFVKKSLPRGARHTKSVQ